MTSPVRAMVHYVCLGGHSSDLDQGERLRAIDSRTEISRPWKLHLTGEGRLPAARCCRVKKHKLMPNETIYTNAFFPMPDDEELYIVGFLPRIVNTHLTHHLIAYLCVDEVAAYTRARPGEAVEPQSPELNGAAHTCAHGGPSVHELEVDAPQCAVGQCDVYSCTCGCTCARLACSTGGPIELVSLGATATSPKCKALNLFNLMSRACMLTR